MWPSAPVSTHPAPHRRARSVVTPRLAHGSFELAMMRAGKASPSPVAGPNALMRSGKVGCGDRAGSRGTAIPQVDA